jgi:hypothetical protein
MKTIKETQCPNCWGYQTYVLQSEEIINCDTNKTKKINK